MTIQMSHVSGHPATGWCVMGGSGSRKRNSKWNQETLQINVSVGG